MAHIGFQLDPYSIEGGTPSANDTFEVYIDGQFFAIQTCTAPAVCQAQHASEEVPEVVTFNIPDIPAGQLTLKLISESNGTLNADFSLNIVDQEPFQSLSQQCSGGFCTPVFFSLPPGPQCNIIFNEFRSRDLIQTIIGSDGPDWLELYNRSANDIDLSDYYLNIYQGDRDRDDKYRWWNNYYNLEFDTCPVYYSEDGCDDGWGVGDLASVPYANRIDVPLPSYPMSFNEQTSGENLFEVSGGILDELPGDVNTPLRKLYGGHWEDGISWNGLVNSNEASCNGTHVCIKGRDLGTGEGGRFWIVGNKNNKGVFEGSTIEGPTGDDWYNSEDIDLATKLCDGGACTGKNSSGNSINAGSLKWELFDFNVSNIDTYNLNGAFTSYMYYEIPKSNSSTKYTIELWKGNPNKYICDIPDPGTNNYYRPCGLQDSRLDQLNDECPLNSQCVLASTILPEPELECVMTYGASDWPTTASDETNKSFQFTRAEDETFDTNDISYFYNWSYAQDETVYNDDGYTDDYFDSTKKTEYLNYNDYEDEYEDYPERFNNNTGFVFPDWLGTIGFYQDWATGQCMQTDEFGLPVCFNNDQIASPLRKNSRTIIGEIQPACINPSAENYYCYWSGNEYDSSQCQDYWSCDLNNFDYPNINQEICPNGQLPYNIASALNLCVFPPEPACLDTGNGEFQPDHKYMAPNISALNAPDDVWICSHNQSTCTGPESTECGGGNECVFNQWAYRECMDSWDNPSGTPGGCCEYPLNLAFGDVEIDEIGYGEASGKTSIKGWFSFPIQTITQLRINGMAGGNGHIESSSGEGANMIVTDNEDYFDNFNFGSSYNIPNSNGGGQTRIIVTDQTQTARAANDKLFSIVWDNDWGMDNFSSYPEQLDGTQSQFSNLNNDNFIYRQPIYPDLLTPQYISEIYGDNFSAMEVVGGSANLFIDCNGVPVNDAYGLAEKDFCNICAGGTTENGQNTCGGDDLGNGRCSEDWSGPNFDSCGVCDGGNGALDCHMDCFGDGVEDCAGVCDGPNEENDFGECCDLDEETDCAGYCNGTHIYDCFGNCVSEGTVDGCGIGGVCNYNSNNQEGGGVCECLAGYYGGGNNSCVECPDCGDNGVCQDYFNGNTGDCTCLNGYYDGTDCGNCCDFNCDTIGNCNGNGTCIAPNLCDCLDTHNCDSDGDGIYECGLPICNGVCGDGSCQNGGYCDTNNPGSCTCINSWTGDNCSTPDCGGDCSPGTCNGDTGLCDCSGTDWCGTYCDTPICAGGCGDENCENGGTCPDSNAGGDCSCPGGYCGTICDSIVCNSTCDAPSSATDCGLYGTCNVPGGTCDCLSGYCGEWCDEPECNGVCQATAGGSDDGCVNGTCQLGGTCQCDEGWSGADCSIIQCNGVDDGACVNGGVCDTPGGTCNCDSTGFCGDYCQYPTCNGQCGLGDAFDGCEYGTCVSTDNCICDVDDNIAPGTYECVDASTGTPSGSGEVLYRNASGNCQTASDYYDGNCGNPQSWNGSTRFCNQDNFSANMFYIAECDNGLGDSVFVLLQSPGNESNKISGDTACNNYIPPGYCGEWCQWPICNGECDNDCGFGTCPSPGDCDCGSTGYCGSNCDVPICNNSCLETDGFSGCYNDGTCLISGCDCEANYCGNDCSDILSGGNCPHQCQHGSNPVPGQDCDCGSSGYCGDNCQYNICNGDCAENGVGTCLNGSSCTQAGGSCTCVGNWDGNYCELPVCGDVTSSDIEGLENTYCNSSGGGHCDPNGTGVCICDSGWGGTQCDVPSGDCNNTCNNGSCTSDPDICDCADNYYKDYNGTTTGNNTSCDYVLCNGEIVNISTGLNVDSQSPCQNSGTCTSTSGCYCINNWVGDSCEIPVCNGVENGNCQNGGTCETPSDFCDCTGTNYCGNFCETPECAGGCGVENCLHGGTCPDSNAGGVCDCTGTGYTGDTCDSIVCNGVEGGDCVQGQCLIPGGECTCNDVTDYCGIYCDVPICNGFCSETADAGYDGCLNGTCIGPDNCDCGSSGYCGNDCATPMCNGECGATGYDGCLNGTCTGVDTCLCDDGWQGNDCSIPICNGVGGGNCENGGTCLEPSPTCDCSNTDYCGNYCEIPICYNNCGNLGSTCGPGSCNYVDSCDCTATGYCGDQCETPECAGGCGDENCVNGTCVSPGDCSCNGNNQWCGSGCEFPICGTCADDAIGSCQNESRCISPGNCECLDGYTGTYCQIIICNETPGGNCVNGGTCDVPGTCECLPGYFGDDCSGICNCNGGVCDDYTLGNTGVCLSCPSDKYGANCEHTVDCLNGWCGDADDGDSICSGIGGQGDCDYCNDGWAGPHCDIECQGGADNQCNGNGVCNQTIDGDGSCDCIDEWNCNDDCSIQKDCHGVCNGSNDFDECGTCACYGSNCGDNTHVPNSEKDCDGICPNDTENYGAFLDDCGCCVGGGTGNEPSYLSGNGECDAGTFMNDCCLCDYSDNNFCNISDASNGALGFIDQSSGVGSYNGQSTYPGYWTWANSKDCDGICFGPNTNITGNWGNHCCCESNISDQCTGVLQDCGCFEQNCYDCAEDPYGSANFDSCGICSGGTTGEEIHVGYCIPDNYQWDQNIPTTFCTYDNCPAGEYCFVSAADATENDALNDACGVCNGDNSTCTIELSFGEIDLDNKTINVFINNSKSRANYISEIRLPIYTNGNVLLTGIDYNDGGLAALTLGDDVALFSMTEPEMYTFNGNEEGYISNVTMNFGQMDLYLPPTSGNELLFTLNWENIENENDDIYFHLWDPYAGGTNDAQIDTYQPDPYNGSPLPLQVVSHSSMSSVGDSIISLNQNLNSIFGCMDPFANNCDSESCGCDPQSKYCVNVHDQDTCTYPSLSFTNVTFNGIIINENTIINPLDGISSGYLYSDFLYTFWYDNFESQFGYNNISVEDLFIDILLKDSNGIISRIDAVPIDSGAYADNVFSDTLWDLANGLPVDSTYQIQLVWPSDYENIVDPIDNGSLPRISSTFPFSISKSGCRREYNVPVGSGTLGDPTGYVFTTLNGMLYDGLDDNGAIVSGYNSWATSDCVGNTNGTDYSCCLYEDFYGTGCKWEDKDGCYICNGSENYNVSYYWYQDQDNDGIPCDSGYITGICPYMNPISNYGQQGNWLQGGQSDHGSLPYPESGEACDCVEPAILRDSCGICVGTIDDDNSDNCGFCPSQIGDGISEINVTYDDGYTDTLFYVAPNDVSLQDCAGVCPTGSPICVDDTNPFYDANACDGYGAYQDSCGVCSGGTSIDPITLEVPHQANANLDTCGVCHTDLSIDGYIPGAGEWGRLDIQSSTWATSCPSCDNSELQFSENVCNFMSGFPADIEWNLPPNNTHPGCCITSGGRIRYEENGDVFCDQGDGSTSPNEYKPYYDDCGICSGIMVSHEPNVGTCWTIDEGDWPDNITAQEMRDYCKNNMSACISTGHECQQSFQSGEYSDNCAGDLFHMAFCMVEGPDVGCSGQCGKMDVIDLDTLNSPHCCCNDECGDWNPLDYNIKPGYVYGHQVNELRLYYPDLDTSYCSHDRTKLCTLMDVIDCDGDYCEACDMQGTCVLGSEVYSYCSQSQSVECSLLQGIVNDGSICPLGDDDFCTIFATGETVLFDDDIEATGDPTNPISVCYTHNRTIRYSGMNQGDYEAGTEFLYTWLTDDCAGWISPDYCIVPGTQEYYCFENENDINTILDCNNACPSDSVGSLVNPCSIYGNYDDICILYGPECKPSCHIEPDYEFGCFNGPVCSVDSTTPCWNTNVGINELGLLVGGPGHVDLTLCPDYISPEERGEGCDVPEELPLTVANGQQNTNVCEASPDGNTMYPTNMGESGDSSDNNWDFGCRVCADNAAGNTYLDTIVYIDNSLCQYPMPSQSVIPLDINNDGIISDSDYYPESQFDVTAGDELVPVHSSFIVTSTGEVQLTNPITMSFGYNGPYKDIIITRVIDNQETTVWISNAVSDIYNWATITDSNPPDNGLDSWNYPYGTAWEFTDSFVDDQSQSLVATQLQSFKVGYKVSILDQNDNYLEGEFQYYNVLLFSPQLSFISPSNQDTYSCNQNIDIVVDYQNIPIDDSLYMAKLELWGLPYNHLVTDPQLLDYSNYQIDLWTDENYYGFNGNGTQLQSEECEQPCNPGENFWYCTQPVDENGDGYPDWGNWTADLPNEGLVTFGNTLETIIPNYQFKFQEDCNSICNVECTTEHHLVFPTNGNFGTGVINLWNEDVWRTGEVSLYIKYPQEGANQSIYDTVTFNVNVSQGCTHSPFENEDGTWGGACTCESCYSLCPTACDAMNNQSDGWEAQMESCYQMGFYNPNSCIGVCDNPGDGSHGNLCHTDQDCNIGEDYYENPVIGEYSQYRGCTRFAKSAEQISNASGACIYPTYGCMDDGNKLGGVCDGNSTNSGESCGDFFDCLPNSGDVLGNCEVQNGTYLNNQYGYGSVIPGIPAENCQSLSCDNCTQVSYIVGNSGDYLDCATTEYPIDSNCLYSACNDVQALTYWANYPEFAVGPNDGYNYDECNGQRNIDNCGVGDESYWITGTNEEGEDLCLYEFQFRLLYQVRSTKYCLDENAGLTYNCTGGSGECPQGTDDECPGDETCLLPTQCDIDIDCPGNEVCYSGDLAPVEFGQIPLDKYTNYDSGNIKDIIRITKPKIFEHGGPQTFDMVFWIEGNSENNSNYPWLPTKNQSDDVELIHYQNGTNNPWAFYNWQFDGDLPEDCTTEDEICEGPPISLINETFLEPNNELNQMSYVYEADANGYRYGISNGSFGAPIDQSDTNIAIKVKLDYPDDPDPEDQISSSAERTIYISLVRNDYLPRVILDNDPNNDGESTISELNPILDVIDTEPINYNFSIEEFNYGDASYHESDPSDNILTNVEVSPSFGLSAIFNGYTDNVGTILLGPPAVRGMWTVFVRLTQLEIKHPIYKDVIRPMVVSTPATFTVQALNTEGPSGSVLGVTVSSFGISPDTWQFKVIGDDKRRYLEFPDPSVPPALPEILESYKIPLKLGYITQSRADGVCSGNVMSMIWTYSNYICDGAPDYDDECTISTDLCNGGQNNCIGQLGTEIEIPSEDPLRCNYGTNHYWNGVEMVEYLANDYCSYVGGLQGISNSECVGNYGGDVSLDSMVYECNVTAESIDLVQSAFQGLPESGHEIVDKLIQIETSVPLVPEYNNYNSYDYYEGSPFYDLEYQAPIIIWDNERWPANFQCWIPEPSSPLSDGEEYYQEFQEAVPGGIMSYPNPNLGGWTTQNMQSENNPYGDSKDTVWMYELQFFQCIDDDCDITKGTCNSDSTWDDNFDNCLYYEGIENWSASSANFIHSRTFKDWWSPDDDGRSLLPIYGDECDGADGLCDPGYESALTYEDLGNTSSDVQVNEMNGYVNQGGEDPSMGYNRTYDLINRGYKFRFPEEGKYKVRSKAYDLYYNTATNVGSSEVDVSIDYLVPIEQTLPDLYLPYQGLNIPPEGGYTYQNDFDRDDQTTTINEYDVDDRPILGCFYRNDENWDGEYWIGLVRNEYTVDDDRFSKWYKPIFVCQEDTQIQCYGTDDDVTCAELDDDRCIYNDSLDDVEKNNLPDFTVDVDVRVRAADSIKRTTLFKYWDPDIHPIEYEESTGPATVQFYFYQRHGVGQRCDELSTNANESCGSSSDCNNGICYDNKVLSPREILLMEEPDPRDEEYGILDYQTLLFDNLNEYYITRLNWGDGSQEYWDEPYRLSNSMVLTHDYDKPGIYEVTGYMFSLKAHITDEVAEGDVLQEGDEGVRQFMKFKAVFSLNKSDNNIYDFPQLGGIDYTYIPQGDNLNNENIIVGGISANSLYAKTLKRRIGYSSAITTPEEPQIFDVKWPFYQDKLDAEYALAQVDQRLIGKDISRFTGSNAASSSQYITEDTSIIDWDGGVVEASRAHGYFSGSVDSITGEILETPTPEIIHRGSYKYYGNLGDHIGDADLGQVRLINKPMEMWEMLGFDSYTLELSGHLQEEWSNNQEIVDKNTYIWESDTVSLNDITVHENIQHISAGQNNTAIWDEEMGWLGQITELVNGESYLFISYQDVGSYTWDTGRPSPAAIPSSEKYWKNIIPSDYELSDRSGVYTFGDSLPYFICEGNPTVSCVGLDDVESCAYLGDEGLSTLCVSADICENQICVDENDLQYWNGTNIYTQGYYYPVLPKVTRYRTFDKYQMQGNHNYFYGTKMRWNANDKIAPITNNDFYDFSEIHENQLMMDLNFDDIQSESILDRVGGGYLGIFTGDYKIEFSEDYTNQDKRGWIGLPVKENLEGGKQY